MRKLTSLLLPIVAAATLVVAAGAQPPGDAGKENKDGGPPPGGFGPGGPGGPPQPGQILPSFIQEELKLTAEQKKQLDMLQKDVDARLAKILTAGQKKKLTLASQPPGPGNRGGPGQGGPGGPGGPGGRSTPFTLRGAYTLDGESRQTEGQTYISDQDDVSAVYIKNGGNLRLVNPTIITSGNTSSEENSSFYGLNAAVLATSKSKLTIVGGTIRCSGRGANGVISTGRAEVVLSKLDIKATANGAHGVMAMTGGSITLDGVNITTTKERAAAIATDRGGGTIVATGGTYNTAGRGSPGIYSTGKITVSQGNFNATGAEACVIEGSNSITLKDCVLKGNRYKGVMVYQSFSGDAEVGTGRFTMQGGSLAAETGPLFFVTNTRGIITLTGVKTSIPSGVLVSAAADRWGRQGSNGGHAVLTADAMTLKGNLVCDEISSITATLKNGTTLTGMVKGAALAIDSTSKWSVTEDSTLKSLAEIKGIADFFITNIEGNGHQVSYDANLAANQWLQGKTYTLAKGGQLVPNK